PGIVVNVDIGFIGTRGRHYDIGTAVSIDIQIAENSAIPEPPCPAACHLPEHLLTPGRPHFEPPQLREWIVFHSRIVRVTILIHVTDEPGTDIALTTHREVQVLVQGAAVRAGHDADRCRGREDIANGDEAVADSVAVVIPERGQLDDGKRDRWSAG